MRRSSGSRSMTLAAPLWSPRAEAEAGFELVGLGEKDGVVAPERRPRCGQRGEGLIEVAACRPDPGPVQLGKVAEAGPGAADHLQRVLYRFSGRGQIASLQSEQSRCPQRVEVEIVAVEMEAAGRGESAGGQGASLFQGPFDEGGLADHSGAENLGQRSADLSRHEGVGQLPGFAEMAQVGVAVHGQRVERHNPVADPIGPGLERPRLLPVRHRLVELADERAVKHVHQRQPHGQLGLPVRVDTALPGERDSPRTPLERPPPQQLSRQGQQELRCACEQLRPDLVEVERAADGSGWSARRARPPR